MRVWKRPFLSASADVTHGAPADPQAELAAHSGHDSDEEEHHNPESLNPQPSYWPIILSMVLLIIPIGTLMLLWGGPDIHVWGWAVLILGGALAIIPTMGWAHAVIVDKWEGHFGVEAQGRDLAMGTKLFFLSEIAIFGSLFAYYFVQRHYAINDPEQGWPLAGTPPIDNFLPAVGLVILLTSSVTCEFAHKALIAGNRAWSKNWLLLTMGLGLAFLYIQGYEYGILINLEEFTVTTNWFGTVFYALTGFHGLHVMSGLIMLMVVYGRLEFGHYTRKRHFSMMAASWYWHLVDVVWVFVFVFVYGLQVSAGH